MATKQITKRLTAKQKRFSEEYLKDLNGTQAAIRAGYSKRTARQIGAENLSKPVIQNFIEELVGTRSQETEIEINSVVKRLAEIAFFDIGEAFDSDGRPKSAADLAKLPVTVVWNGEKTSFKVQSGDKIKALELLGRHFGMFNDKLKVENEEVKSSVVIHLPHNFREQLPLPGGSKVVIDAENEDLTNSVK